MNIWSSISILILTTLGAGLAALLLLFALVKLQIHGKSLLQVITRWLILGNWLLGVVIILLPVAVGLLTGEGALSRRIWTTYLAELLVSGLIAATLYTAWRIATDSRSVIALPRSEQVAALDSLFSGNTSGWISLWDGIQRGDGLIPEVRSRLADELDFLRDLNDWPKREPSPKLFPLQVGLLLRELITIGALSHVDDEKHVTELLLEALLGHTTPESLLSSLSGLDPLFVERVLPELSPDAQRTLIEYLRESSTYIMTLHGEYPPLPANRIGLYLEHAHECSRIFLRGLLDESLYEELERLEENEVSLSMFELSRFVSSLKCTVPDECVVLQR